MSTTEYACKACGTDTALTGYDGTCNALTLVVVAFTSEAAATVPAHMTAVQAVNAFFAEYGIGRDQLLFPPTTNTAPDTDEDWGEYTITFVLEVPAYVAKQIREARDA